MQMFVFKDGEFEGRDVTNEEDESVLKDIVFRSKHTGKVHILNPEEYSRLLEFKSTHPDYIEFKKAKQTIADYRNKHGITGD